MVTAEERLQGAREHFDTYERLAQAIGVDVLRRIVPFSKAEIVEALKTDKAMNNLRLRVWDVCDTAVREAVRKAGGSYVVGVTGGWSLCNSGCVLKHVARHHIAGEPRP